MFSKRRICETTYVLSFLTISFIPMSSRKIVLCEVVAGNENSKAPPIVTIRLHLSNYPIICRKVRSFFLLLVARVFFFFLIFLFLFYLNLSNIHKRSISILFKILDSRESIRIDNLLLSFVQYYFEILKCH